MLEKQWEDAECPLQWGRNFLVTEISSLLVASCTSSRFNGAVTFWLRKFELCGGGEKIHDAASMGP